MEADLARATTSHTAFRVLAVWVIQAPYCFRIITKVYFEGTMGTFEQTCAQQ